MPRGRAGIIHDLEEKLEVSNLQRRDLVMLIQRMMRHLKDNEAALAVRRSTHDYLLRKQLVGSVLRGEDTDHPGVCRVCGCTDMDCRQCIAKTGHPCSWGEPDLCSACAEKQKWDDTPFMDYSREDAILLAEEDAAKERA